MPPFRPLLAATIDGDDDLRKLRYPLIGSPKVDGIRCFVHPELGPVTRSLKPIPNVHIRNVLSAPILRGLDGELVVGEITAKDVFNRTTSAVMSQGGDPNFTYYVFDRYDLTNLKPYEMRRVDCEWAADEARIEYSLPVSLLTTTMIETVAEALELEAACVEEGFEGLMLRSPQGPYKHGRSTLKEQTLLKLKRFIDDEAKVVGFQPLERNTNRPERNALGLQERSDHKAGKIVDSTLGNLIVEHSTFGQFSIGSGFDATLRARIWASQNDYLGRTVTFKYQKVGVVDKPRFPIFLRFREAE